MKRIIQRTLPLMFAALVAGCGLTQSVTDGTKDVAKAVFYKKVKTVHLEFRARAELNPDEDGMSLATRVQVLTLKDRQAFDKADYNTLISDAEHALSTDLVAKKSANPPTANCGIHHADGRTGAVCCHRRTVPHARYS